MVDRAYNLVTSAAGCFADEALSESNLKGILPELLVGRSEWQKPTSDKRAKPGGVWPEGHFAYLIVELKNEPGLKGDPFL